jgi:hypothetical protein
LQAVVASAQTPGDSIPIKENIAVHDSVPADTTVRIVKPKQKIPEPIADSLMHPTQDSLQQTRVATLADSVRFSSPKTKDWPVHWMDLLKSFPFLNFSGNAVRIKQDQYEAKSYDGIFYMLVGLLFLFAIIKLIFSKYLGNLLILFFRVSMRQQQIREQVIQSPVPSLLLNLLFVLSGGLYGSFLLINYNYVNPDRFWAFFLYGSLVLAIVYLVKFLFLKTTGWIFNIVRPVETYLFIVFMTNKIIGIFLLPFLVILSFSSPLISLICITISAVMIVIFYIYRLIASFKTLRKEINISGLHFILYLCAFEIAPLLLIYKVLLTYLEKAY